MGNELSYLVKTITVRQKMATGDGSYIVCGNSNYSIKWDLDAEWDGYNEKTMLVVLRSGQAYSVSFTGDTANLPALSNTNSCVIGLMAGDIRTTTGAWFVCRPSIRDASGTPVEPPADLYTQLLAQLDGKISEPPQDGTAGQALVTDGAGGRSWATVQGGGAADAVLYTEQELEDAQKTQARANIGAISSDDIPVKLPNPYPLEFTGTNTKYDGSTGLVIDIRPNFAEYRADQFGYIKNNPFAGSGKTYLPNGTNWTNEFAQSSTLNFEIDGTQYYNVKGVEGSPMYMLTFSCGDYTIELNRMNTTFSISPSLGDDKWFLLKIGTLPQVNMEADPASEMQIATKQYVDNHVAASGKDGITPTIGDNGNWYLGDNDTGKPSRGEKGDTGNTGPQGPAGQDGKDGAGMDVTGATVGQIAKISAVDADGKPTAWEPVDMPSGGGEWEYINSITLESDVGTLLLSTDAAGNAIEYDEIALVCVFAGTSANTAEGYVELKLITQNGNVTKDYTKIAYARRKSGTVASVVHIYTASAGDYTVVGEEVLSGTASATNIFTGSAGIKCCGIRLWASDNEYIGAGTTIQLFGRNGSAE